MLGGWQEVLPEPRASCQRLYFTAVSLWLFSWEHADLEGREIRASLGSPSIPWGLAGWGQRLQDRCRQQGGGRTWSWWVLGVFGGGAGK